MKTLLESFILALAIAILAALPARADTPQEQLQQLGWLAGCWRAERGEAGSMEHWLPPAGGTMLGVGRTVRRGKTVEHEFMQIRESAEGQLVYVALPSGQKETTFTLKQLSDGEVTFENLAHDFPQRVIYRLGADGRLAARIEGLLKGVPRVVDFPMQRVACDAAMQLAVPASPR